MKITVIEPYMKCLQVDITKNLITLTELHNNYPPITIDMEDLHSLHHISINGGDRDKIMFNNNQIGYGMFEWKFIEACILIQEGLTCKN